MSNKNSQQDICMTKMAEQIKHIEEKLSEMPTRDEMALAFKKGLEDFNKECDQKYASKNVEKLVYGAVGMILTAVFGALIYLVVK